MIASVEQSLAAPIGIQFDISQTTVSILGGTILVPPDGNLSSSVMRVVVQGTSPTGITGTSAIVRDIDFDLLSIDQNILGEAHVTGSLAVNQIGDATGTLVLSGGNAIVNLLPVLNLAIDPNIQCSGAACSLIASFPFTSPATALLGGALTIANITQSGAATLDQSFSVTFSGVSAVLHLVGQEVQRTFVPEPASATLLGFGLFAAAALGRRVASRPGATG